LPVRENSFPSIQPKAVRSVWFCLEEALLLLARFIYVA
jgi:hypothetical protein